jgi:hypothetical protein
MAVAPEVAGVLNDLPGATIGQTLSTPPIIAFIMVVAIIEAALITGIIEYRMALTRAEKAHPNSIGYGKIMFLPYFRYVVFIVGSILVVVLFVASIIFVTVFPGPLLASKHAEAQKKQRLDRDVQQARALRLQKV